jgi:putative flippase GtrA
MRPVNATRRQFWRYVITGLGANAPLYACYLLLSQLGIGHKVAMTVTYCTSVLCTFVFNRRWTFGHGGDASTALLRYIAIYALGYVFNLAALSILVDVAGLPHQAVMGTLIVISAGLLFLAQKFWVFPAVATRSAQ